MSFNTGLSGLKAASQNLDVIGHNIANANTTGMKASRAEFAELFAVSIGATGGSGGGIGVEVANVAQQFSQGNVTVTGNDLDLAINGPGFFSVQLISGDTAYTRSGEFKLDENGFIVTNQGAQLLGYQVNATSGLIDTAPPPSPLQLPTETGLPATQTTEVTAGLNLDSRAAIAVEAPPGTFDPPISTYGSTVLTYDTQGNEIAVSLYYVKRGINQWEVFAEPAGGARQSLGNIAFDLNGLPDTADAAYTFTGGPIQVPSGATTVPTNFPVTLNTDAFTQFSARFSVFQLDQDGYPKGDLAGVTIAENGEILARYTNGRTELACQLSLTNFRNLNGLQPQGGGYWLRTVSAGDPIPGVPRSGGFGTLRQGALEASNVDITAELVNMMTAQRAYQANAQTIKTQDQVLSTLVNLR